MEFTYEHHSSEYQTNRQVLLQNIIILNRDYINFKYYYEVLATFICSGRLENIIINHLG